MSRIVSVSLCARVTLDLHNMNSEGTEGNQQQTRMVHILDQNGERAVVNAISGDMFKHILVEHLIPLLDKESQPLSPGARLHDADRINSFNKAFVDFCEQKEARRPTESEIMTRMLQECSLTDIAGALVTRGRSVGRKSVVEFGWVVGLPDKTVTEQYFHVKYAPEGRAQAAGGDTVAGRQAIFHRPASSGEYALICNLDLYRIGLNDISRGYSVDADSRLRRARALLHALIATLLKPTGAQRNTQNPHIVGCRGVVTCSSTSLPAPTVSPLNDSYLEQIEETARVLNAIEPGSITVIPFESLAGGARQLALIAAGLETAEVG
ncbi:MAG: DevR family CRISPR-associated autoregulator [Chloroflexota bacterium]